MATGPDTATIDLHWCRWQAGDGRAALRRVLASYLDVEPAAIGFTAARHGKPRLAAPFDDTILFNWSHCRQLAVIAVARGVEPGIDIERVDRRVSFDAIARRWFAPSEQAQLRALQPSARREAFLRMWTAKEAVLKATGKGISHGLDRVGLALQGDSVRLLEWDGKPATDWQLLQPQAPEDGYLVALAWQGSTRRVRNCGFA